MSADPVVPVKRSKIDGELAVDDALADEYLQKANARSLYDLYHKRSQQLIAMATTMGTLIEMANDKGKWAELMKENAGESSPIASMERVALAAIALGQSITDKAWQP